MKNLYLVQISVPENDIIGWLPYSAGVVWAYATTNIHIRNNVELKEILFRREKHQAIISRLDNPDIVGISCYTWNKQYSLTLAKTIKSIWPQCVVVAGGPEVNEEWMNIDYIDSLVIGEGEQAFVDMLVNIVDNTPLEKVYRNQKITNLEEIPSPYTLGIFDSIISQHPDIGWYAILESSRGCPYSCTFCDWGGATNSKIRKFTLTRIENDLKWFVKNNVYTVLVPDANFGIFKQRDKEIAVLIRNYAELPESKIQHVMTTYAKNTNLECFEIEQIFGPYSYGMTVSVQSMSPGSLEAIKRNLMKINELTRVFSLSEEYKIKTYTEIILGLPRETLDEFKSGIAKILELGQHNQLQVWILMLIPNSEMNTPEYRQMFGLKTRNIKTLKDDCYPGSYEESEFIIETDSMSFDDLVEAYMYAWMLQNFHYAGYTEWFAKYCRNVHNIPYRTFYDRLFKKIQESPAFKDVFIDFKENVVYQWQGNEADNTKHLVTLDCNINLYYSMYTRFIDVAIEEFEYELSPEIIELQKKYIITNTAEPDTCVTVDVDLFTWEITPTTYILKYPELPVGIKNIMLTHNFKKKLRKFIIEKQGPL